MAHKLYQLKFLRNNRDVRDLPPIVVPLDLEDLSTRPDTSPTRDLLDRNLYAAVARAGSQRHEAHLFVMEVREIAPPNWTPYGDPKLRWSAPVDPEVRR